MPSKMSTAVRQATTQLQALTVRANEASAKASTTAAAKAAE